MIKLKNRKIFGLILLLIGSALLFSLIITKKVNHQLFYISGLGASISSAPSEMEVLNYNLNFSTLSNKNFKIESIEPILNEKLKNILLSNSINISVEKTLSRSKELFIEGKMIVNTSTLEEEEINKLLLDLNTLKNFFNIIEEQVATQTQLQYIKSNKDKILEEYDIGLLNKRMANELIIKYKLVN